MQARTLIRPLIAASLSVSRPPIARAKMHIQSLPVLGSSQNYAYIVTDDKSSVKSAVVIDPADPPEYDTWKK